MNKSSKCRWVLDIPEDYLKKLSPQLYEVGILSAGNMNIEEMITGLDLTLVEDYVYDDRE